MFFFVKKFILIIFIIELTPLFDVNDSQNLFNANLYFNVFIICFLINLFINRNTNSDFNFDIIFKFFSLIFKNPSFLLNYIINTFKKIFLFLYHFKYRTIRLSFLIFSKKYISNFYIWWKPLFKKTSYFGYYRSNRSKWIK